MSTENPGLIMIREWLRENERSQKWLANKLRISSRQLNRIMNGEAQLTVDLVVRMEFVADINCWMVWRKHCDWVIAQEFARQKIIADELRQAEREMRQFAQLTKRIENVPTGDHL